MRWLFVVFVVSLCALLWASISVARYIRRDRALRHLAEIDRKQDS